MTQQERDQLHWLKQAKARQITQKQTAALMQVSERWVRRLLQRMKSEGDRVVVHKLRGRPSNRKLPDEVRDRALALIRQHYHDFGPTLASEYLADRHAVQVSKETLRRWMIDAGIWRSKKSKLGEIHLWRARCSCFGEMAQWDTSDHDWLEGRGPRLQLIAMLDDATSRGVGRFALRDTTAENMSVLECYLKKFDRMASTYTDKASMFVNTPKRKLDGEMPEPKPTQIGRALKELGIVAKVAHSPEAKGRIERFFETAQDRLVKGLRVEGICTQAEANRYLEEVFASPWRPPSPPMSTAPCSPTTTWLRSSATSIPDRSPTTTPSAGRARLIKSPGAISGRGCGRKRCGWNCAGTAAWRCGLMTVTCRSPSAPHRHPASRPERKSPLPSPRGNGPVPCGCTALNSNIAARSGPS